MSTANLAPGIQVGRLVFSGRRPERAPAQRCARSRNGHPRTRSVAGRKPTVHTERQYGSNAA